MGPASLAMYDTRALRDANDALWAGIRDALRTRGMEAPDRLDRDRPADAIWIAPDLVLAQTCGLPYVTRLRTRTALLGAPDYGLPDCPPGYYNSVIITRKDNPKATLAAFSQASYAYNATDSQSGYASLHHHCARHAPDALGTGLPTGAHLASIAAVASGAADLAAIDAVTFRLAAAEGRTAGVSEIARTRPTPGLPFITAPQNTVPLMQDAIEAAISRLSHPHKTRLGLHGFVRFTPDDYTRHIHPAPDTA